MGKVRKKKRVIWFDLYGHCGIHDTPKECLKEARMLFIHDGYITVSEITEMPTYMYGPVKPHLMDANQWKYDMSKPVLKEERDAGELLYPSVMGGSLLFQCPKCGGLGSVETVNVSENHHDFRAECCDCDFCTDAYQLEDEAADAWNKQVLEYRKSHNMKRTFSSSRYCTQSKVVDVTKDKYNVPQKELQTGKVIKLV